MKVVVCLFIFLFCFLFSLPVTSLREEDLQNLHVEVVEGTLHVEYTLMTEETVCKAGDALKVTAHISWHTEKEKTTVLSVVMEGTPYTQSELSEQFGTLITLEPCNGSSGFESEDISGFWDYWFDEVSEYGFFSDYANKVMYNWNEVEITLHEDHKGRVYILEATYYDYFTKFYPTPEDFFAEREIDFQLVFGIHHIAPLAPLFITITLPEDVEIVRVEPPSLSIDRNNLTLAVEPGVELSNVQVRFKIERYLGTELPRLQALKEISSHHVAVNEQIDIVITVENTSSAEAAHVTIQDNIPEGFEIVEGDPTWYVQALEGKKEIVLTYTVKSSEPGDFILKGTQVEFEDQFGKIYTVYSNDISVTVVEKSIFPAVIVIVTLIFYQIKKRRRIT